ncbi:MAG: TssQ family T6SS-associated lipoprotein [Pseudomonadota bacterium]
MKNHCPSWVLLAALTTALLGACVQAPTAPTGLMDVAERPAEKALLAGMRAYDEAQYTEAEKQLNAALQAGLASPKDRAAAHKHLAFLYCTSKRTPECEAAFRAARQADPAFALSKSEAGHPLWGPVYQRVRP